MQHDIRGLPQTTASAEAMRAFDAMVEAYLGFQLATGDRWAELAEKAARLGEDHMLVFADAHYMMALAAEGADGAPEALLSERAQTRRANAWNREMAAAASALPVQ